MNDSDNVVIGELCPPGYAFINRPRPGSDNHGGIGVLYRYPMKLQEIPFDFQSVNFEYTIISNTQRKVYYAVIYRPPPSPKSGLKTPEFLIDFESFLEHITPFAGNVIKYLAISTYILMSRGDLTLHNFWT